MKKLHKEELKIILGQIEEIEKQYPKANVFYNVEERGIQIIFPLPKDFYKLKDFEIKELQDRKI